MNPVRILFVDDEKAFRVASRLLLEAEGYIVDTASDGLDAEHCLERNQYDVIITDIVMPKKEGIEFILDIRMKKLPVRIIAISGGGRNSGQEYLTMASAFKADAILAKPYAFKDLLAIIRQLTA
jgi:DNA-binding response OmpR family regulator